MMPRAPAWYRRGISSRTSFSSTTVLTSTQSGSASVDTVGVASAQDAPHAVDFLVDHVLAHPGEIHLLAIGPLTNVAAAIAREPRFAASLKHLTIMGGWFAVTPTSARGPAEQVASVVRALEAPARANDLLAFDDETGKQVDLDLRADVAPVQRGRGRPALGVEAKEVTLLPRHWEWLAAQRGGASATLARDLADATGRTVVLHDDSDPSALGAALAARAATEGPDALSAPSGATEEFHPRPERAAIWQDLVRRHEDARLALYPGDAPAG